MRADFHSSGFNAPSRTYNNVIARAYMWTVRSQSNIHDTYYILDVIHPSRTNYNMWYILCTIQYVLRLAVVFIRDYVFFVGRFAVNIKYTQLSGERHSTASDDGVMMTMLGAMMIWRRFLL